MIETETRAPGREGPSGGRPASALARAILAVFAAGIPLDVVLATRIGSSSLALGVPLAVAAGWQVLSTGRVRPLPAPLLFATAFTAWAATSMLWAAESHWFGITLTVMLQLLAFVLLSWQILRSRADLKAMLAGYVGGCTIAAADGWRAFMSGEMHKNTIRYTAEAFDPNDMAVTLAIGIPAAAYLALGGRRWTWLVLGYLPIAGSAVVLSGSRAGVITSAVAVAVAVVIARSRRRSGPVLVAAVALLVGGIVFAWRTVPRDLWTRLYTIREQVEQGDLNGRTDIWRAGLDVFARNPVAGVGQGGFKKAVSGALHAEVTAHSTLLPVAAELGLVGLVLFLAAFASALLGQARVASDERALAFGLVATWLVGSATLYWELRKTTWFVLLVATAIGALRRSAPASPGVTTRVAS